MQNFYQLFGVSNFASLEEIAAAYKQKHAELFSSDSPLANIPKLRELKDAFDLLSDDERREEYDEKLADFLEDLNEKFEEAVAHLEKGELQRIPEPFVLFLPVRAEHGFVDPRTNRKKPRPPFLLGPARLLRRLEGCGEKLFITLRDILVRQLAEIQTFQKGRIIKKLKEIFHETHDAFTPSFPSIPVPHNHMTIGSYGTTFSIPRTRPWYLSEPDPTRGRCSGSSESRSTGDGFDPA